MADKASKAGMASWLRLALRSLMTMMLWPLFCASTTSAHRLAMRASTPSLPQATG
jgi:hypothetical protein